MGQILFADAIKRFKPDVATQMAQTWDASLYHNPVMWGTELLANALDDTDVVSKDQWNENHPEYRQGIKWFDGMTQLQARID